MNGSNSMSPPDVDEITTRAVPPLLPGEQAVSIAACSSLGAAKAAKF
jgi:hypothetical protein